MESLKKKSKDKFGSIQWVIDKLSTEVRKPVWNADGYWRTDSSRADKNTFWCPKCRRKWNIFEKRLWASPDRKLWKEKICRDCDSVVK